MPGGKGRGAGTGPSAGPPRTRSGTAQMSAMPTADATVQHPLTLVMSIKSPEDRRALQAKLDRVQSLPRDQNPVIVALDKIGTVHFARFVFIDETRLAVITTYDGDF